LKDLTVVSGLCAGDPVNVEEYCKKLIDVVGKGGGFILDGGIGVPDESSPSSEVFGDAGRKFQGHGVE